MAKNSSMNEELRKWIEESKEEIKKTKKKSKSNKKPKGKCEICGQKTATSICLKCGKSVCNSCYFKIIGVCKKCIPSEVASKWDGSRPDWEKELGVEWVG
jgi:hypothetical protein